MTGKRLLVLGLIIVSLIGLADALYLSVSVLTDTPVLCVVTTGCSDVAQSPYSRILGIPMALYGVLYYVAALLLSFAIELRGSRRTRALMLAWAIAGVLFSGYTFYLQAAVIHAWCMYCIASEAATVLILAFSFPLRPRSMSGAEMLQ